jgi:hypothetical protein
VIGHRHWPTNICCSGYDIYIHRESNQSLGRPFSLISSLSVRSFPSLLSLLYHIPIPSAYQGESIKIVSGWSKRNLYKPSIINYLWQAMLLCSVAISKQWLHLLAKCQAFLLCPDDRTNPAVSSLLAIQYQARLLGQAKISPSFGILASMVMGSNIEHYTNTRMVIDPEGEKKKRKDKWTYRTPPEDI